MNHPRQTSLIPTIITMMFLHAAISTNAQTKGRTAPPFLVDEIHRLAMDCYYFSEYLVFEQNNTSYTLALFQTREGVTARTHQQVEPCGLRTHQVRLYRFITDSTVLVRDSLHIDRFSIFFGSLADFDNSGTAKFIINHRCETTTAAGIAPLTCYSFSVYEVTADEQLRTTLIPGLVPPHRATSIAGTEPLEPVHNMNLDRTPYPELLAVDDFFEEDPAFRPDDFPKVTLIYAWDDSAKVFRHRSSQYPSRFHTPDPTQQIPDSIHIVLVMEWAMSLAAVGKTYEALKFIDLVFTPQRFMYWRSRAPERSVHIEMRRLREKLLQCISRYDQS